jgi:multicomponent Na+:H+ antiporter subunit C
MMAVAMCLVTGFLFACAVYGLLRRSLVRIAFGILLLSHAANLLVFTVAGLTPSRPAIIEEGKKLPSLPIADPLPQALVLTAIVIGFGLITFVLALIMRAHRKVGSDDINAFTSTEQ